MIYKGLQMRSKVSVNIEHMAEILKFHIKNIRIYRQWVNRAWDPPTDVQLEEKNQGEDVREKLKMWRIVEEDDHPHKKMKVTATENTVTGFLRRSRWDPKKPGTVKTPYKAPPNPALTKTPEPNLLLDPFNSPTFSQTNRFYDLLGENTLMIGYIKTNSAWFSRLDDANKHVSEEEAVEAMMYFNYLRQVHASYFHNNWYPGASFCTSNFFNELLKSYSSFKNTRTKTIP